MEEKVIQKAHKVTLSNRRSGILTGVLDVLSFDLGEIQLETEQGMLTIKGKDMHVTRLTLEKGEVEMEGKIDSLQYSDRTGGGKGQESFLGKLFK